MRSHFFLKFKISDLEKLNSVDDVAKNLLLPENKFPPKFLIREENFLAGGYFVAFSPRLSVKDIVKLCQDKSWSGIASINGDFLIFYFDLDEKKFFVISDQFGKFPCYFIASKDLFAFSTSFYNIFKQLDFPKLNINRALEFIYRDVQVSDKTIIEEIFLLPPGSLGEFRSDGTYKIKKVLGYRKFLETPFEKFKRLEDFADAFYHTLDLLVRERVESLGEFKFCSEISSGLDSSLVTYLVKKNYSKGFVCYSEIAKDALSDTQPEVVLEFANKHKLDVRFVEYDDLFPFSTNKDLEFIKIKPSYIQKSQVYRFLSLLKKEGNLARFTGEGGDEAYWSSDKTFEIKLRFPKRRRYFIFQSLRKYGIDRILTEKGVEKLLDKERFRQEEVYPLIISNSVATLFIETFPFAWEAGVWSMTPFVDLRLLQIARGIPSEGIPKSKLKLKIWERRGDIFTQSQFKEKGGTEKHYHRFLIERKKLVCSILSNSVLGQNGWVRASEIFKNISSGKLGDYMDGETMAYLINLLELEYFIQQNAVKVAI